VPICSFFPRSLEVLAVTSTPWPKRKIHVRSLDGEHQRALGQNIRSTRMCARRRISKFTCVDQPIRCLRKKNYVAFGVGIKLKTTEFQILTRQHRLSEPTDVAERLYSVGVTLLNHADHPGPFRLIGLVAYDLVGIDDVVQLDLFSTLARQRKLELAIDGLAERFGTNVVYRADDLNRPSGTRLAPTLDFLDDRALD
jgi:hypothetical protein